MNPSEENTITIGPRIDFEAFAERFFGGNFESFWATATSVWEIFSVIAILLSIVFVAGMIYAKIRVSQLGDILSQQLLEAEAAWAHAYGGAVSENNKWADIQDHIASDSPTNWRVAIIEADIMLEDVLEGAGFVGATIGEKLKSANSHSFQTLEDAWTAHKTRNQIAHAGSDFVLTKKMANDAILQFERVFREFGAI